MAQIQMTDALANALIARMQAEYGQQAASNFALDILLDSANAEIARLKAESLSKDETNAAFLIRLRIAEDYAEQCRRADDPHRAKVMDAADKVKDRKGNNVTDLNKL